MKKRYSFCVQKAYQVLQMTCKCRLAKQKGMELAELHMEESSEKQFNRHVRVCGFSTPELRHLSELSGDDLIM